MTPKSCIECPKSDVIGYCKILNDRQEDYALKRHKNCPIGEEKYEQEEKEKQKRLYTEEEQDDF